MTINIPEPAAMPAAGAEARAATAAAHAAGAAFDAYRGAPLERRAALLEAIADGIEALGEALVETTVAETALPPERIRAERARTTAQLRLFAEVVRAGHFLDLRVDPRPEGVPGKVDMRARQVPVGPVAVFGASNFPLAFSVAGGDTASALAAGAPVVVKSHPAHLKTGRMVAAVIKAAVAAAGLPAGTFGFVEGAVEAGATLAAAAEIRAVAFTGSRRGGLALVDIAARRPEPIPVFAEMSSINPVVLLSNAVREKAEQLGRDFVASMTLHAGQYCTNPGLILAVDGPDLDRFLASAGSSLVEVPGARMLTDGIQAAFERGVQAVAARPGVDIVARGHTGGGDGALAALFVTDAATFTADPTLAEEVFGAHSLVVRVSDEAELRRVLAGLEGQLTATLHLVEADHAFARALLPLLERKAGRILANGWPTGVQVGHATVHGGPYPATSDSRFTSVGTLAIRRFLRPVAYQDLPDALLPVELSAAGLKALPHVLAGKAVLPG